MASTMSISYKVTDSGKNAVGYDLARDMDGEWTKEDLLRFTKKALITIAKDVLKEEQNKGFDKNPTVLVDNKFNRKEEEVKPFGKIQYIAKLQFREVITETYKQILYRSKVLTGRYFASNVVTYNGIQVATNPRELDSFLKTLTSFKDKDIFRFINTTPYARRLENLGVTRQRSEPKEAKRKKKKSVVTVIVPNGAYHITYLNIKRRYKKNTFVGFDWMNASEVGLIQNAEDKKRLSFKGKKLKKRQLGRPYLYPTIIIRGYASGSSDVGGGMLQ